MTPSLDRLPTKVNEYHLPGFYFGVVLLLNNNNNNNVAFIIDIKTINKEL